MSGSASSSYTGTPYAVSQSQLAEFMNSGAGQNFASLYDPNATYYQNGQVVTAFNSKNPNIPTGGQNVTNLMAAFNSWQAGNQQTQNNWQNYANAVNASEGGEGDQTVTSGSAVSQRSQLLGALTQPNTPAGALGAAAKRMGFVR